MLACAVLTAGSSPYRRLLAGSRSGGQPLLISGFERTGEIEVPPYTATSGSPYCLSLPRVRVVTPLITSPKFHTQAPRGNSPCPTFWFGLSVSVQNG